MHVHHGRERLTGAAFAAQRALATSWSRTYALAAARSGARCKACEWERVVLDEAQNIKSSAAKQTQRDPLAAGPPRVALTGTPVENRLCELTRSWTSSTPAARLQRRFPASVSRARSSATATRRATERLRARDEPVHPAPAEDRRAIISDLPEKIEMRVDCHSTREQATLYQAVVDEMLEKAAHAEGIERRASILAALMKLKQVCNHPAQLLQTARALAGARASSRGSEIARGGARRGRPRAVLHAVRRVGHDRCARYLQERLGREVLFLHGGTRRRARDEMVARFQTGRTDRRSSCSR